MNMTKKQVEQFNLMLAALRKIARGYQTASGLQREAERRYGLEPAEALEYAYENIQQDAASACKGVREITSEPLAAAGAEQEKGAQPARGERQGSGQ